MDARHRLLQEWADYLRGAAEKGALPAITAIEGIAGPRAGALEIRAGLGAGELLRKMTASDAATLRQFVPWPFSGDPQAYMAGRYVRLEAGWPGELAETMIRLGDLGRHPAAGGRWIAGKNELGATVITGLSDRTPHFLVAGTTGSGKSVALRSAVLQLSADPANELVLIDGKYGESLAQVAHLRGVVGPVATETEAVRAALGWACASMRQRYESGGHQGRVVVVFDEIQEFADDDATVGLLKKLVAQGRAAGVHCVLATQHPTVAAFGDPAIRRNLVGKLALQVGDPDASRVAVGGNLPRADHLLGAGDTYTVAPGVCHRVQGAFVDARDFDKAPTGAWLFDDWPEYDAGQVGQELPGDRASWSYTGGELAVAIVAASEGEGRPAMVRRLEASGLGRPGAERAIRLLNLGRDTHGWLEGNGYYVTEATL
ncbi:MAG: FtsK/SpoIIIE domain-containing protein [Chloroflexota bacterium]